MFNGILSGAAKALRSEFGDSYEVYQNDVRQGLQEPCFFLAVLKPERMPMLGNRYAWTVPLDVHFFPETPGKNDALLRAAERMTEALETVTLPDGGAVRGHSMRCETEDGVLHVFVEYRLFFLAKEEREPAMESLALKTLSPAPRGAEERKDR